MIAADLDYVRRITDVGIVRGPVLELGAGYGGQTSRQVIEAAGLEYFGTDLDPGPNVNFVANFEQQSDMAVFNNVGPFGTVLILNVLEHTFDPIRIIDNALQLVRPGGHIVLLTPAVWTLHNYPMDAWRLLPNFYEEYAKRRGLELLNNYFEFVGFGRVKEFVNADGAYSFPPPCEPGVKQLISRAAHKIFNTFGREMHFPNHVAVAATLSVPDQASS